MKLWGKAWRGRSTYLRVRVVPRGEGIEWDTEKSARPGVVGHNGFDRAPRCVLCAPATTSVFFLHRQDLKSRTKSRTFRGRKNTLPKGSCDLWSHLPPRCRAARNRAKRSSWTTCVSPPCVSHPDPHRHIHTLSHLSFITHDALCAV